MKLKTTKARSIFCSLCALAMLEEAFIYTAHAQSSLPSQTFWDHTKNNWPSDLISVSEYNENKKEVKKILDFLPLVDPYIIQYQSNLNTISSSNDPNGQVLAGLFNDGNDEVEAKTWNGSWISDIVLPDASTIPHLSEFQLSCGSAYSVKVRYNNVPGDSNQEQVKTVTNGNSLILAVVDDAWITVEEYDPTSSPTASPTSSSENKTPPVLHGTVLFAQSQIMPSKHGVEGDDQPHLTAYRKTLVMLHPKNLDESDVSEMKVTVRDVNDAVISDLIMSDPNQIPKHDGYINLGNTNPDDIDFPPSLENSYNVQGQSNLNPLHDDKNAAVLTNLFNNESQNITVKTWDGSWIRNFYLPDGNNVPSTSKLHLACGSGYSVTVYYPNTELEGTWRSKRAQRDENLIFVLVNGVWIHEDDLKHNSYIFGYGFFTAILEKQWIQPGITIQFSATPTSTDDEVKVGILSDFEVGATTELMLTTIDVGMLTPPRGQFSFRDDVKAHEEYFETAPLSRLIVVQYETMHFEEIMLPSGKFYTTVSDDDGGWHGGDMRQHIGKVLISHGIDMANYGIHSSKGDSESSHPFTCALLTAHNTVGMYQNGRIVHGGSGGNGMITLDSSLGNEFSHEVGHNYGLGHYVGGFDGSVHKPAEEINSSWGWDSKLNIFRPNFDPQDTGDDTCLHDECQSAFMNKFRFGTDSMAGGYPMWTGSNRFTMYTPYVAKIIQTFLENKAVWDPDSTTGFRKFDQSTKKMVEYTNNQNGRKVPRLYRVAVTTIVGYYDPSPERGLPDYIYPALHGAYGYVYDDDGEDDKSGCQLKVKTNGNDLFYSLTTEIYSTNSMNKFHVNVATEVEPSEASIYCFGKLRKTVSLKSPNSSEKLIYTVNGMPFGASTTISPTKSPTESPTKVPTKSPSLSPTSLKLLPPTNDPWLIGSTNATTYVDFNGKNYIGVSNKVFSGPKSFRVSIYEDDCSTPIGSNEVVSVYTQDFHHGDHLYYSLDVDESKLETSTLVDFDDNTKTSGTFSFCTMVATLNSDSLVVATKKSLFKVGFDFDEIAFILNDIDSFEENVQEINLDITFEVTACECNATYHCVRNLYAHTDTAPEFRVCVEPKSPDVSVSNLQLTLSNQKNAFEYKPASFGASGPSFDEVTSWSENRNVKNVQTRLVSDLFNDGNRVVTVSGMVALDSKGARRAELEHVTFDIEVQPNESSIPGCRGYLKIFQKLFR